jgi:hypothetical protein
MGCLLDYYVHQRDGINSGHSDDLIGPLYVGTPYEQRGEGIDGFLAGIFRALEPLTIRGARAVDRKVQNTGNLVSNNPKQTSRISWSIVWPSGCRGYSPNSSYRDKNETVRHHHHLIYNFGGEED